MDPELSGPFPTLAAYARVYADDADVDGLVRGLSQQLARQPGAPPERTLRETLAASTTTRGRIGSDRSWVERLPAAYDVPSLALPLVAVMLVFGINDRRLRRRLTTLTDLGVGRSQAVTGLALAAVAWALAAALAGAAAGLGLALAARPMLQELHTQPLSPFGGLEAPVLRLVAMVLVGGAAGTMALYGTLPRRDRALSVRLRPARRLAALVTACAAVLQLPALDSAVYEPPRSAVPPLALSAAATGLALLTLMSCLAVAYGQATTLRGYLGGLIAIGLPTSWARRVLLLEQAVVLGVGTALAMLIAIPPVVLAAWRIPGFELSVPWDRLFGVIAAVYLASVLALLGASRRLRSH